MKYIQTQDHPGVLVIWDDDKVMALFNKAIKDNTASIVNEETNMDVYWQFELAYQCFKALKKRNLYQYSITKISLTNKLHNIPFNKGANLVQL